jgi:hypothetical protein
MLITSLQWGQKGQQDAEKLVCAQAAQKGPDARRRAMRGARRTYTYVAAPRKRANAADGPFSAACQKEGLIT